MCSYRWFAIVLAATAACTYAAEYPSRPIRLVVPFTAGSASDLLARLIGPKLAESWGQQVVIDNRPSAGGTVAGGIVAASAPDGHTLMITSSAFAGAAALYDKLPYDSVKDFAGITMIAVTNLVLVTAPNGPKTVKEFIALAQQKPGQINYGSSGIGSGTHYGGELFKLAAKINIVHVPYRGVPEALTDTMSGRIHSAMSPVLIATPLIRSGRIVALGVTSTQRLPALPEVPTIAEAALPGFVYDGWFGALAPARTPRVIIDRLSKEIGRIIMLPENQERVSREGSAARVSTPEQFEKLVREEIVMRSKVFKAAGSKPE
ncbi:MAG: tripartite tricarboxylate transporter substrate binding protein [Pseudomonadota bacterium]